jgi:hypothetical protein
LSPYEKLYNQPPDYQRLRVFGFLCYLFLRPYGLHKLKYRSKPCIFLGYQYAGYKCLDPIANKVYLSRHTVFAQTSFPTKDHVVALLPSQLSSTGDVSIPLPLLLTISATSPLSTTSPCSPDPTPSLSPIVELQDPPIASRLHSMVAPLSPDLISPSVPISSNSPTLDTENTLSSDPPSDPSTLPDDPSPITFQPAPTLANPVSTHTMVTRSQTGHLQPKQFSGFQSFHTKYPLVTYLFIIPKIEPSNYRTASPDPRWQATMKTEFEALLSNGTWSFCPRPHNQHVIHKKWVYKIKRKDDSSVERFKARLVVKGFEQQSGIDFIETFSYVIKPSTIRIILALAVFRNWLI